MWQLIQAKLFFITSNVNSLAYENSHLLYAGIADCNPVPALVG